MSLARAILGAARACLSHLTLHEEDQITRNRLYHVLFAHDYHVHIQQLGTIAVCWSDRCEERRSCSTQTSADALPCAAQARAATEAAVTAAADRLIECIRDAAAVGARRLDDADACTDELALAMRLRGVRLCDASWAWE